MMNARRKIVFLTLIAYCSTIHSDSHITIRPAIHSDVSSALELNWRVSMEYFKPLFRNTYAQLPMGKDPDYYLGLDAAHDAHLFPDCVNLVRSERLHVAFDEDLQKVAGLIVFHQEPTGGEIDLMLVDKEYRRMGLGKKLACSAFASIKKAKLWEVYVFSHNQEALAFYRSLGFVDMGLGPKADRKIYPDITYAQVLVYLKLALDNE